ncbi:MAG: MFS transporter [Actinobacteria bacterium]|nr:MFS transporter [Actinomycetota bacterium]
MRRLLALVSSIIFVDAMLYTALTPLVPGYAEEFGLSKTGAGLLVGAFGAGALFGGIPGGLAAARFGPRSAVIGGLVLLGIASLAFAAAGGAVALGIARFAQGFSSTVTWAGALAWIAGAAPKAKRGEMIGTAFGAAIAGAILGPMFGGLAETVGIRVSLTTLAAVAFAFALLALVGRSAPGEKLTADGVRRAFRDIRFLGGLWLNTLPALLFGVLVVLTPLALDDAGWSTLGIAAVFFAAGLTEVVINPFLGRATDRLGRLLPIRFALAGSIAVAVVLAASSEPILVAILIGAAGISFGSLYTPGMALTSHRAENAGLAQGLAFGIMNTAWALGALIGPSLGGALAESQGDSVPYLLGAVLCALTLVASYRVSAGRMRAREA